MLDVLANRVRPFRARLRDFLLLAAEAQDLLDRDRAEELPGLAVSWQSRTEITAAAGESLFPEGLRFLGTLDALEPDWRNLLIQAETAPAAPTADNALERIAVYFAFRYLLKAVNDGDLLSRARLCVFSLLTVERLAAVCGLPEALGRFSREIEHSGENLEALLTALWQEDLEVLPLENDLHL
jgi:lysine-N-methylase